MRNQECQALGGNLSLLCLFPKGVLPLCSGPGPHRAGTQIGSHSLPRKKRKLTHTISQTRTKPELLSGTLLGTLNIWLVSKQLLSWKITIFQRHDLRIHTEHLIFNKENCLPMLSYTSQMGPQEILWGSYAWDLMIFEAEKYFSEMAKPVLFTLFSLPYLKWFCL